MTDVFISYARSTEVQAKRIAEALRTLGYAIWSDEHLPAHRAYADVIEERLNEAKAVVVIWSSDAVKSEWVRSEANRARESHKLVQIAFEPIVPPIPFDQIQCADMSAWTGANDDPGWRKLIEGVAALGVERRAEGLAVAREPPDTATKPSVGVAPFVNLSNDPTQDYFVDGMTEDVVAALARFRTISVVAGGSKLSASGAGARAIEAGRRLGVRYMLEGSVRKAADHVRIVLKLIDVNDGAEIWADRIDEILGDEFVLQDRVAFGVASAIEPAVKEAEMRRLSSLPARQMGSYDLYLRASALLRAWRKDETLQALEFLEHAIELKPEFAAALAMVARAHARIVRWSWSDEPEGQIAQGSEQVALALRFGGDDAYVLAQAANALPDLSQSTDRAVGLIDRSLRLNPGAAYGWLVSGWIHVRTGVSAQAMEHLERAEQLEPFSTVGDGARAWMAIARFQQRRLDEALELFSRANIRNPDCIGALAALYGCLGQIDDARRTLRTYRQITNAPLLERVGQIFVEDEQRVLFAEGIRAAEG
ncbi:MAG TPA: TIR domain-containing protein [Sphingomicrobium sp.]|nr:TIR domain-containing protein [Sphingomicrobium sp.]